MEVRSSETVICALNDAGFRYLIVGGMAVVAHRYVRYTAEAQAPAAASGTV